MMDMSSFKEFLEDYEKKEDEEIFKFKKRLEKGKVSPDERYPPNSRFFNLKEPVSHAPLDFSVWSVVPFYGSTIITLPPPKLLEFYSRKWEIKLTKTQLENMIDFVKETGRIQFMLGCPPTDYKNFEIIEGLLRELKPPLEVNTIQSDLLTKWMKEKGKVKEYVTEFFTLANFGLDKMSKWLSQKYGKKASDTYKRFQFFNYVALRYFGYDEVVDKIEELMLLNPREASGLLEAFNWLVVAPTLENTLKAVFNYSKEYLDTRSYKLGKASGVKPQEVIPCDVGKFILEKLVKYPLNLRGCWDIIQEYQQNDLYKVMEALDKGVKQNKIDIVKEKRDDLSTILDNVWNDTSKIRWKKGIAKCGITSIGLIGGLSTGMPGPGVLSALGFQVADRILGMKSDSISEKIAKFISPNHLVTIYDFKKKTQSGLKCSTHFKNE